MKLVLIYLGRKNAGPIYSLEMAKELNKKVELLCVLSNQITNLSDWNSSGLNIYTIDTYNSATELIKSTFDIKKFIKLKNKIKEFNPDIIYYPMVHFWLPIINFILKKTPQIFTAHDPEPHLGEHFAVSITNKYMLKNANGIVILSNIFTDIIKRYGYKENQIEVIQHGHFNHYNEKINKNNLFKSMDKSKKIVLFFGRIDKYKGISYLINAFNKIKKDIDNIELWIVGSGNINEFIEKDTLNKDIKIINKYIKDEEVGEYFTMADVVALPYVEATQSGVIPIAYSFSKPVIATNIGGLPEQVEDGYTGFLVSPKDSNGLADKIKYILENDEIRLSMGKNARKFMDKNMTWNASADKLLDLCNRILNTWNK